MGKRRKAGNINPKKRLKKQGTAYYNREQEINYLLNNFTSAVYNPNFNLQNIKSYKQMNEIRMKLKKLFDQQGDMVWKKSAKRRRIYDEQLSKFKVVYTRWKSETYITYLNVNFCVKICCIKYFLKFWHICSLLSKISIFASRFLSNIPIFFCSSYLGILTFSIE